MKSATGKIVWIFPLVWWIGCAPAEPSRPPNLILIVIDTLRADHVGSYGYLRDTTPNLDALSQDSHLYERALSSASWTLPAVGAIMTGVYPNRLGVKFKPVVLPAAWDSLATRLKNADYKTCGLVSHTWVGDKFNFHLGFDHWDQKNAIGHENVSSPDLTQKAESYIAENQQEPFFLFLHYFDPHYDYIEHEEQIFSQGYTGNIRSKAGSISKLKQMAKNGRLRPEDLTFLKAAYDSEIHYVDSHIGRVIAQLKALDLYNDSLIIVTGDHGEAFVERPDRHLGHIVSLYQELIHVPLLVKYPGNQPRGRVGHTVSTIDIYPTVLDVLDLEAPTSHELDGTSLRAASPGRAVFFETKGDHKVNQGVVRDEWKLLVNHNVNTVALYNLDADPGERDDMSADYAEIRDELQGLRESFDLRAQTVGFPEVVTPTQTPKEIEALRALGYMD